MATDLFNNPSNDYVNPALSPCVGASDDSYFEIGDGNAQIVSGSDILAKIDLSDIKIGVSAFSTESKIISEGEVVYIPGLTKGLQKKVQGFTMPTLYSDTETLNPYFLELDLSISYYRNFKYTSVNIDTSANYAQNITIEDALNIALGNAGAGVTAHYDPSTISFTGGVDGFNFEISNVVLGIIDASENTSSPFPKDANAESYNLEEDPSSFVSYAKYPNGASQGIIMKSTYPSTTPQTPYDKWLYINHVSDFVSIYDPIEIDNFIYNIQSETIVTFDSSIIFGPLLNDVSLRSISIPCVSTGIQYDPSVSYTYPAGTTIDSSVVYYSNINNCDVSGSIIYYSEISNFQTENGSYLKDSSVYGSDIYDNTLIPSNSDVIGGFISDSSLSYIDASGTIIQKSWIKNSFIKDASVSCIPSIKDSSVVSSNLYNIFGESTGISESEIGNGSFIDSSIYDSYLEDSSLLSSYVSNTEILRSDVSVCKLDYVFAQNTILSESIISDSSILGGAIDASSSIAGSTIQNIYTNAYRLVTGDPSVPYIWVIDDDTLTIDDPSLRVTISGSSILDSSINNADIIDSSIYTTYLQDVSLSGCTLYNIDIDGSTTTLDNCKVITINADVDCSVGWDTDSSTLYTKSVKSIDVGMNGCSTDGVMSAGDYLDWITTNNYWNKFGDLYAWTSAPDGCSACHNLIDGFYVFNPHTFDIKIEYMLFI